MFLGLRKGLAYDTAYTYPHPILHLNLWRVENAFETLTLQSMVLMVAWWSFVQFTVDETGRIPHHL